MITVENFVDPSIVGNPPILINPKILFMDLAFKFNELLNLPKPVMA